MVGMRSLQDTFEIRKRSFISGFSIYMTVPLIRLGFMSAYLQDLHRRMLHTN